MSLSLSTNLSDTEKSTIHTQNLCLKAEIKGYRRILQTANDGRKKTSFSLPETNDGEFLVCYLLALRVHFASTEG